MSIGLNLIVKENARNKEIQNYSVGFISQVRMLY
jgi:hypothetical protein